MNTKETLKLSARMGGSFDLGLFCLDYYMGGFEQVAEHWPLYVAPPIIPIVFMMIVGSVRGSIRLFKK